MAEGWRDRLPEVPPDLDAVLATLKFGGKNVSYFGQESYLFLADGRVYFCEAGEIREVDRFERAAAALWLFESTAGPDPMPTPAES